MRWQGELFGFIMVVDSEGTVTTAETALITHVAEVAAPLPVTELQGDDDTPNRRFATS